MRRSSTFLIPMASRRLSTGTPIAVNRPMFYVYDSYLTKSEEWATILAPDGENTLRGTKYDSIMIGLWVKRNEETVLSRRPFRRVLYVLRHGRIHIWIDAASLAGAFQLGTQARQVIHSLRCSRIH